MVLSTTDHSVQFGHHTHNTLATSTCHVETHTLRHTTPKTRACKEEKITAIHRGQPTRTPRDDDLLHPSLHLDCPSRLHSRCRSRRGWGQARYHPAGQPTHRNATHPRPSHPLPDEKEGIRPPHAHPRAIPLPLASISTLSLHINHPGATEAPEMAWPCCPAPRPCHDGCHLISPPLASSFASSCCPTPGTPSRPPFALFLVA